MLLERIGPMAGRTAWLHISIRVKKCAGVYRFIHLHRAAATWPKTLLSGCSRSWYAPAPVRGRSQVFNLDVV